MRLQLTGSQNLSSAAVAQLLGGCVRTMKVLEFRDTARVVQTLVTGRTADTRPQLRSLHAGEESQSETLAVAVAACPHVEHVYLVTAEHNSAECVLALLDLSYLRELHVREDPSLAGGRDQPPLCSVLGPVVARHGGTLVSLNLAALPATLPAVCESWLMVWPSLSPNRLVCFLACIELISACALDSVLVFVCALAHYNRK